MRNVADRLDWKPRARAYNNISYHCRGDVRMEVWRVKTLSRAIKMARDAVRDEIVDPR